MLKIENLSIYGWEPAIRGMRNPLNSWEKSDSRYDYNGEYLVGENDLTLMRKLVAAGNDHSKFMRMITITCDITAPLYWWKEYDTYKVGTVANSCSTMHTLTNKPFELSDFSLDQAEPLLPKYIDYLIETLNDLRDIIRNFDTVSDYACTTKKQVWQALIQILPESYNQRRTVHLNYAVARNIYHSRRNHKLLEWHTLCDVFRALRYSDLITGEVTPV